MISGKSLIVQGWQRAGGLVSLFDPARGPLQSPELATPATIVASWNSPKHGSQRPLETITPLADKLKITPKTFVNDSATADDTTNPARPMTARRRRHRHQHRRHRRRGLPRPPRGSS